MGWVAMRPLLPDAKCTCGHCARFEEARELLSYVPPEVNRDLWLLVIWAVSDMLQHSSCGAKLVAAWSEQSIIESRRDGQEAERIYQKDRRFENGVDRRSAEDVDETFLKALAVLCGAPDRGGQRRTGDASDQQVLTHVSTSAGCPAAVAACCHSST